MIDNKGVIIDIEKTDRECCGNCIHGLKDDITHPCSVCEVAGRDFDYVEIVG